MRISGAPLIVRSLLLRISAYDRVQIVSLADLRVSMLEFPCLVLWKGSCQAVFPRHNKSPDHELVLAIEGKLVRLSPALTHMMN